jgi:hypothetical protein
MHSLLFSRMQGVDLANGGMRVTKSSLQVIFVLGGPGSGKGTQVILPLPSRTAIEPLPITPLKHKGTPAASLSRASP